MADRPANGLLAGVLDVFFKIAKSRLHFTDVFLQIAFHFHIFVIQYFAGYFLDFAFDFFNVAFHLIFIHNLSPEIVEFEKRREYFLNARLKPYALCNAGSVRQRT